MANKQQQHDQGNKSSSISLLPSDILMLIFCRLPIKSIAFCRCVSKLWLKISTNPVFTKMHFSFASKSTPQALMLHIMPTFYHNPPHNPYVVNPPKDLFFFENLDNSIEKVASFNTQFNSSDLQYTLVGSCNGLLCLSTKNDPVYVCNPITKEYLTLPKAQIQVKKATVDIVSGFGFDPISEQYKVIRVFSDDVYDPILHKICFQLIGEIYTIGSGNWRKLGDVPYRLFEASSKAFVNGNLHWTINEPSSREVRQWIASFSLYEEKFVAIPPPPSGYEDADNCARQLMVLEGHLCVYELYGDDRFEIWTLMNYGIKESWSKQYVIPVFGKQWNSIELIRIFENGDVLLLGDGHDLYSYDPVQNIHKDLIIPGLSSSFNAISYVPSLISLTDATRADTLMRSDEDNIRYGAWSKTLQPVPSHKPILERKERRGPAVQSIRPFSD